MIIGLNLTVLPSNGQSHSKEATRSIFSSCMAVRGAGGLGGVLYLGSILGKVEWDALPDLGGKLGEHLRFEPADHDLSQASMQLVQVRRPPTVPLTPAPEEPEPGVEVGAQVRKRPPPGQPPVTRRAAAGAVTSRRIRTPVRLTLCRFSGCDSLSKAAYRR